MYMEETQGTIIPEDSEPYFGLKLTYNALDPEWDGVQEIYRSTRYNLGEKQDTPYYCGPYTVRQMLHELYNVTPSQEVLAHYAGTTSQGTTHTGMQNSVKLGVGRRKVESEWKSFHDMSWKQIGETMAKSNVSVGFHVAYRNKWGHYMYPVYLNLTTQIIGLLDSLNKGNDVVYVTLAEFELWIKNTPGAQKSVLLAYSSDKAGQMMEEVVF